jgi:hypothetical protein
MYDTLLFLHLLSAAALFITVVMFSAFVWGAELSKPVLNVANAAWAIGGLGTIIFGVWLAIYVDGYQVWDGWVLIAIGLWLVGTETGRRAQLGADAVVGGGGAIVQQAVTMHWVRTLLVVLLLADMVWKPWA